MEVLKILAALTPAILVLAFFLTIIHEEEEREYRASLEPAVPEGYLLADGREVTYPSCYDTFSLDTHIAVKADNRNPTLYLYRDDVMNDDLISKIQDAMPSGIKVEIVYENIMDR